MSLPLNYADLGSLLASFGYEEHTSAYHGAVCGALCRQAPDAVDPVALLQDEDAHPDAAGREELLEVRDEASSALNDMQTSFTPLLPSDEAPLSERASALSAWCEGFLYGVAGRVKLDLKECSDEVREVLRDFTEFTRASIEADDDPETEESAYAELVEYVRVGAQLVYMELHPRPPTAGTISTTLH